MSVYPNPFRTGQPGGRATTEADRLTYAPLPGWVPADLDPVDPDLEPDEDREPDDAFV